MRNDGGLPTRPYYKHMLYATGSHTVLRAEDGVRHPREHRIERLPTGGGEVPRIVKAVSDEAAFAEQMAIELESLEAKPGETVC